MKRITACTLAVLLILSSAILTSCKKGGIIDSALLYVGIDSHNYEAEETTAVLSKHDEAVSELFSVVSIILPDTPDMQTFSGSDDVAKLYTDRILIYLLSGRYSKYNGNPELLEKTEEKYPGFHATTVIPEGDFDSVLRKYFGGGANIRHSDGKLFRYLKKANVYVTEAQTELSAVTPEFISCEETENTYRLTFRNHLEETGEVSPDYLALFIKNENGSVYMKSLKEAPKA